VWQIGGIKMENNKITLGNVLWVIIIINFLPVFIAAWVLKKFIEALSLPLEIFAPQKSN
jgi:hypothetical protein